MLIISPAYDRLFLARITEPLAFPPKVCTLVISCGPTYLQKEITGGI